MFWKVLLCHVILLGICAVPIYYGIRRGVFRATLYFIGFGFSYVIAMSYHTMLGNWFAKLEFMEGYSAPQLWGAAFGVIWLASIIVWRLLTWKILYNQDEAREIFDRAEPLAGAIGCRIDCPQHTEIAPPRKMGVRLICHDKPSFPHNLGVHNRAGVSRCPANGAYATVHRRCRTWRQRANGRFW